MTAKITKNEGASEFQLCSKSRREWLKGKLLIATASLFNCVSEYVHRSNQINILD